MTFGEFTGLHKSVLYVIMVNGSDSIYAMLCMLALAGFPSFHGYYPCMVYWVNEAFRRNCRQSSRETSFSPIGVFVCFVGTLLFGGGDGYFGICGLVGPDILARPPDSRLWRFSILGSG